MPHSLTHSLKSSKPCTLVVVDGDDSDAKMRKKGSRKSLKMLMQLEVMMA